MSTNTLCNPLLTCNTAVSGTFGMIIKSREFVGFDQYRMGFNGKENDNDVKGEGNQQDYGFRIYDSRLGRFLSVDPLKFDYPWLSTYQFAANMPIVAIDLDGLENVYVTKGKVETMKLTFTKEDIIKIVNNKTPEKSPLEKKIYVNEIKQTPDAKQFKGANVTNENKIFKILYDQGQKNILSRAKEYDEYNKTHDNDKKIFEILVEGPLTVPPPPEINNGVKMKTIRVAYISVHVDGPQTAEVDADIEFAKKQNTNTATLAKEGFDKIVYLPTQYNPKGTATKADMDFFSEGTQRVVDKGNDTSGEKKKK